MHLAASEHRLVPHRSPQPRSARRQVGLTVAASIALSLAGNGSASAASAVAGGAHALSANVSALIVPLSVGALPSVSLPAEGGGPYAESLLTTNVAGLAPIRAGEVSTEGNSATGAVKSSASLVDANIAGLVSVSAARSRCSAEPGSAAGSASVADLVVAGIPISTVDVGPNTTITLPVGRVIINEQRQDGDSGMTVNAVHVTLDAFVASGDVVLSQSRCSSGASATARAKAKRAAAKSRRAAAKAKRAAAKRLRRAQRS